jgi:hypothetical protein
MQTAEILLLQPQGWPRSLGRALSTALEVPPVDLPGTDTHQCSTLAQWLQHPGGATLIDLDALPASDLTVTGLAGPTACTASAAGFAGGPRTCLPRPAAPCGTRTHTGESGSLISLGLRDHGPGTHPRRGVAAVEAPPPWRPGGRPALPWPQLTGLLGRRSDGGPVVHLYGTQSRGRRSAAEPALALWSVSPCGG